MKSIASDTGVVREFFKVIVDTALLNVFEMDPLTTMEGFAKAEKVLADREGKRFRKWFPGLFQFGKFCLGSVAKILRFRGLPRIPSNSVVFFATTNNQRSAVDPVRELLESETFLVDKEFWHHRLFPITKLISLFFWPCGLVRYWTANPQQRKKGSHYLSRYFSYYGIYFVIRLWSWIYDLKLMVISNDHIGLFRVVNDAVRSQKIPTAYVQHACVASYFPDLDFDYSFLDGLDAAEKYDPQPGHGHIFLAGIAKFKHRSDSEEQGPRDGVGVCFNLLDSVEYVGQMLTELTRRLPEQKVVARLHPATPSETVESLKDEFESSSLEFSDARQESSFDFTSRVNVLVCGASSIILEAAMTGTPSVAYFSEEATDVYDFVKNGLCEQAASFDELEIAIRNQTQLSRIALAKKVEYYSAGFADQQRPPSAQLISNVLDQLALSGSVDFTYWKRCHDFEGNVWALALPTGP